jgi:hypothetical protein
MAKRIWRLRALVVVVVVEVREMMMMPWEMVSRTRRRQETWLPCSRGSSWAR